VKPRVVRKDESDWSYNAELEMAILPWSGPFAGQPNRYRARTMSETAGLDRVGAQVRITTRLRPRVLRHRVTSGSQPFHVRRADQAMQVGEVREDCSGPYASWSVVGVWTARPDAAGQRTRSPTRQKERGRPGKRRFPLKATPSGWTPAFHPLTATRVSDTSAEGQT